MPYAREPLIRRAIISDTFETAITWERFEAFHNSVKGATEAGIRETTGRPGEVTCRFTHIYPDRPAPYFSFHALGQHGELQGNGIGSSKRRATRSLAAAARSLITMRSGASTGRGMTRSAQICSQPPYPRPSARWIRKAC